MIGVLPCWGVAIRPLTFYIIKLCTALVVCVCFLGKRDINYIASADEKCL